MEEQKPHKIEDVKNRLYDRREDISTRRHEGILHQVNHKAENTWSHNDIPNTNDDNLQLKPHSVFFKRFFFFACLFFVGAMCFAFFTYYKGNNIVVSSDKIDIKITGSTFVEGGQELPIQIDIINNNNASLELVNLSVEYPRGEGSNVNDIVRLPRENIGSLIAGEHINRTVKATLYGQEKSVKNIVVILEYQPQNSNAIFTKKIEYPVTISTAPLSLIIDAPKEINSNQDISLHIKALLNTTLPSSSTLLQVEYPSGFVFESALPKPSFGNSVWNLDSITLEKPFDIVINGRIVGQENDEQVFNVSLGSAETGSTSLIDVVYSSLLHAVKVVKPFLETHISINGQDLSEYTASPNTTVNGQISWVNNSQTKISDATISLNLSGSSFDREQVNANEGFFDSSLNRIFWDKEGVKELSSIEPGESGKVAFSFDPLSKSFGKFIVNPQVNLDVSLTGRQPTLGTTFADVKNIVKKIVKINTDFQIISSANYVTGYLPPKTEQETKYKITWTLSNTNNKLDKASASTLLPSYVKYVGGVNPILENVTYNSVTREVVWNIGSVAEQTGFKSNREVSFIIALSPSLSQVGSTPILTKEMSLVGTDTFTGNIVKDKFNSVNTLLVNDPKFKYGNERVIQ